MPRARRIKDVPPDANAVLEALLRHYPSPDTELAYTTPFELLVATVLSAQSTDKRVNETTPALFARYPDAAALAAADPADIEPIILATGFFRAKSKAIVGLAQQLMRDHGGEVPADMAALTALPGVGRKTANVVLGHALGVPGLPVDRHVLRVAERIGLSRETTPDAVEQDLCAALPPARWTMLSDALILHGRRVCRPKPMCAVCEVVSLCRYPFKTAGVPALDLDAPPAGAPRRAAARTTTPAPPSSRQASRAGRRGPATTPPRGRSSSAAAVARKRR